MQQEHNELETSFGYRLLTTLLLLALLLEWLFPWLRAGEWSMLLHPQPLIWMTVIMLGIGLTRPRLYWFISIGFIVLLVELYMLFAADGQHIGQWLLKLVPSLGNNIADMFKYGLWYMSDEFRTLLLFIGWLLLAPALQSVVWHYQFSLALVAGTIAYLVTIHTVLGIDIWLGLLRVIGIGLLLIAVTTGQKLQRYMVINSSESHLNRYRWISITLLTAIIVISSFFVSDNKVKRSEPVAWAELFSNSVAEELAAWSQQSSGVPLKNVTSSNYRKQSTASAGYDLDDSQLGAKLNNNASEVVFHGWSSQKSYWRGESKSLYTGKGWSDVEGALTLHKTADDVEAALAELGGRGKGERIEQSVTYVEPVSGMPLMQGGLKGIVLQLEASDPDRQLSNYIHEPATDALFPPTTDAAIKSYTLITELPMIEPELLNELEEPDERLAQRAWESEMLSEYLQLPDSLPERVVALAAEVAGGGLTGRYDQVKAIEQYLKDSYRYSFNSRQPGEDEDFVDHFLFEQQRGYCVHFATAMVVMLRSQDIPARYVKGYQSGEAIEQRLSDAGLLETLYKVSESDAHAWVEVYFPEVGWVPFDPTPAASESETQAQAAWFGQLNKLKDNVLSGFKGLSDLLTLTQWQWLAASLALLLVGWISLLLSWRSLRRNYYLRSYTLAYRGLNDSADMIGNSGHTGASLDRSDGGEVIGQSEAGAGGVGTGNDVVIAKSHVQAEQLESSQLIVQADQVVGSQLIGRTNQPVGSQLTVQAIQPLGSLSAMQADQLVSSQPIVQVAQPSSLPARSKKQLVAYKQALAVRSKLQQQLLLSLEWLVDDLLNRWEQKNGLIDEPVVWHTWRQRMEVNLQRISNSSQVQQQLVTVITALEGIIYSNGQVSLTPQELRVCLLALYKLPAHKTLKQRLDEHGQHASQDVHRESI